MTTRVKEALAAAFEGLGGVPALIKWAKAEPGEFYKLWTKLLPMEVTGSLDVSGNLADQLERLAVQIRSEDDDGRRPTIN